MGSGKQQKPKRPARNCSDRRLDESDQALPRYHLIHLDQEQRLAGLLALAGVLGIGEGHLLHQKTRWVAFGYFAKIRKSFSDCP